MTSNDLLNQPCLTEAQAFVIQSYAYWDRFHITSPARVILVMEVPSISMHLDHATDMPEGRHAVQLLKNLG